MRHPLRWLVGRATKRLVYVLGNEQDALIAFQPQQIDGLSEAFGTPGLAVELQAFGVGSWKYVPACSWLVVDEHDLAARREPGLE